MEWFIDGQLNSVYVGSVESGKYHGLGTWTSSLGVRYEGQFKSGRLYGITKEILSKPVFEALKSKPRYADLISKGEGEWINNEFVVIIVRVEDENALCGKSMNKSVDCKALVMLLELNVKSKKEKARKVEELKNNSLRCLNAVVPESISQKSSTSEFYGNCSADNFAKDGVVVWKTKGVPVDIECLSNGAYTPGSDTTSFKSCEPYWVLLPGFCKVGDYLGQCHDGKPQGVGFMTGQRGGTRPDFGGGMAGSIFNAFAAAGPKVNYTIYIERGMFLDGKLNGFGRALSLSGCGQAGCSGSRVNDVGWFKQGDKQFDCSAYSDCIPKLSGRDLTEQKKNWVSIASENQGESINADTFEGALKAYIIWGRKNDLKQAQSLAKSVNQKKQLEFQLLQTVGFEKVFHLTTKVRNGKNSVGTEDTENLLGLFRMVNSSIPLDMIWNIKYDNAVLPLTYGSYAVELKVGVKISKTQRSCFGSGCTDWIDVQPYIKNLNVILRPASAYGAQGNYELLVSGASQSAFLGAESGSVISGVEPVISIESVRQLP